MDEYKNIVLLKGLENMDDYQFRTVKSLLRKELKLTKKMQEDYDRIHLADWMEDKFPKDAGLDKLIKVCEHIKDLKDLAKKLKTEQAKVQKKKEGKCKTAGKKKGQDELSSSESLFNNKESNKSVPSSKKKRKQITKTEGGKKKKLTQEQAQLPETSGTNIKKDEDCLQNPHKSPPTPPSSSSNKKKRKQITKTEGGKKKLTQGQAQLPETSETNIKKDENCLQNPHKPPPTPSSSSSNKKQKNRTIRKHIISKTEGPQEKQQRVELSSISNFQAVSELLTFEGLSAIPSSRLQSSQKPLEAHLDLKMSPSSPTSPCHNLPVSPSSDSSVHLNSNAHSILISGAQVPHVPSATGFSNVGVPLMPSETVFSSSSAPQISQITVPSSIRDLYLPKPAAFNSTEAPHKQAIASRNGQTTREPSAKLTSKSQFLKLHPPATESSNSQVHHTLATMPRSVSVTRVPQTRTSSSIQTLNSATVKASKNVQAPQVSLPIRPNYFLASVAPPSATPNRLTSHGPLLSIATSRAQTTQIEPGTESICVQALHAPPSTVSRSKCTTPLTQGAESSTGKALTLPKVKACSIFQAPRVSSPTASSSIMKPHATSSKTSSSLLDQHATSSTASSSSLLALKLSPVTASRALSAIPGLSATIHRSPSSVMTFSSNNIMTEAPRRGTVPKEHSREEGHHQGPKQVMVLKVTEPFTYDFEETKRMFHATVATETEFFRVKVFDTALMSKFIPGKIIAISHYVGCNGFLEIYRASCVSDVNINPTMIISNTLSESAIATPKISYLLSQAKGTFVNGEFVVFKKSEKHECICYGIGDDTGKMAVVVYGRLTNVRCEPGSKLRLVCFELTSTKDVCLLRSVRHSYMQVINEGKPLNPDSVRRNSLEPYF